MSAVTHQHSHPVQVDEETRRRLGRRAQLLAGASVTYNLLEAVIAITAGLVAGSVALIGFGLDSVVEVPAGSSSSGSSGTGSPRPGNTRPSG